MLKVFSFLLILNPISRCAQGILTLAVSHMTIALTVGKKVVQSMHRNHHDPTVQLQQPSYLVMDAMITLDLGLLGLINDSVYSPFLLIISCNDLYSETYTYAIAQGLICLNNKLTTQQVHLETIV